MEVDADTVRRIARLARLRVTEEEEREGLEHANTNAATDIAAAEEQSALLQEKLSEAERLYDVRHRS